MCLRQSGLEFQIDRSFVYTMLYLNNPNMLWSILSRLLVIVEMDCKMWYTFQIC